MPLLIENKAVTFLLFDLIALFLTTLNPITPEKNWSPDWPIFSFGTVQLASKFMVIINASNKACGFH